MSTYLKLLLKNTLFWYIYFVCQKLIFLTYNYSIYSQFSAKELLQVFVSGAILDISFVGYIIILPCILLALSSFIRFELISKLLNLYHYIVIAFLALLAVIDLEMLQWWGIRSDKTIFKYIFQVPEEILATSSIVPVHWLIIIYILIVTIFIYSYRVLINNQLLPDINRHIVFHLLCFVILAAAFVIPIRGGFQQIPINQSSVYFSRNNQLNLAAINLPWNFANSFIARTGEIEKPYKYPSISNGDVLIKQLFAEQKDSAIQVLNTSRPNILVIIWESFTYKSLNDPRNITPGFNELIKEGVFFNNIYSTGDRSDKGLTGILSGYPALPRFSIMNEPVKASKIPALSKSLADKLYTNSFYYGGEPEFANLKSYLLSAQFDYIFTKGNFPAELHTSKWGVHDEHLFAQLLIDLPKKRVPFFTATFTLSSHEPYDVPVSYIEGKDNESKFCNSLYYADQELYKFINQAKKSDWWENTLVVIIADHGHIYPGQNAWATRNIDEYHMPMLWLGGAVKQHMVVNKLASQTDLASTLLAQLDIDHSGYIYSKDIFTSKEFAYYAFNNGFGYITPHDYVVYENVGDRIIHKSSNLSDSTLAIGKAYQEVTFRDYVDK